MNVISTANHVQSNTVGIGTPTVRQAVRQPASHLPPDLYHPALRPTFIVGTSADTNRTGAYPADSQTGNHACTVSCTAAAASLSLDGSNGDGQWVMGRRGRFLVLCDAMTVIELR